MAATWIISANASRARFFSQANASAPLEEIHDMVNEAARLRMLETTETDKRGPTSATKNMHNVGAPTPNKLYEPPQTPDQHEAELFARDITEFVVKSHQEGGFQQLSLVVSPKFLGMLRKFLEPKLGSAITLEVDKDYTHLGPRELHDQLQANQAKG